HAVDQTADSPGPGGIYPGIAGAGARSGTEPGIELIERVSGMVTRSGKAVSGHLGADIADGCDRKSLKHGGRQAAIVGRLGGRKRDGDAAEIERGDLHRDHYRIRS